MKFKTKLVSGRLIKRYKRFLADIILDSGEEITAHCANPGAMTGLMEPGSKVWLSISDNPKRKLKYSWELVEPPARGLAGEASSGHNRKATHRPLVAPLVAPLVGINTGHPNAIVTEAIEAGAIKELLGYGTLRREIKYGENSRIDILLEDAAKPPCYVEVKSVTLMREAGLMEFPDSVTARGAKHLGELSAMACGGARAVMFYLIQRSDTDRFSVAGDIDPKYATAFGDAHKAGVEMLAYDTIIDVKGISLGRPVPIVSPTVSGSND